MKYDYDTIYDDNERCEICGLSMAACTCPECSVCGVVGNPACIDTHMPRQMWPALHEPSNTGMKTDAAIAVDDGENCSNRGAAYA